jgi:hypothetical protein
MVVEQSSLQVPKARLLVMVVVALVLASVIVVCFVLPAEYHLDPTGVGKLTGVSRLAGAKTVTAADVAAPPDASGASTSAVRYYEGGYRSDFVDIPLTSGEQPEGSELEYKVRMKTGGTLAYTWTVSGLENPEEFYFDFHGEAPAKTEGAEATVVEYKQATGTHSAGTLVAPLDGVFGWYLQNQSSKPVVVHLKISGFYDLVAPGEYGNNAGIKANEAMAR